MSSLAPRDRRTPRAPLAAAVTVSLALLGTAGGTTARADAPQYQITPLVTSFGLYNSSVRAINNNGVAIGFSSSFPVIRLPNGSGYTDGRGVIIVNNAPWRLEDVRGTGIDINDSGQIIGTRFVGGSDTVSHPFFYNGSSILDLTTVGVPADANLAALNNAGTIVGTRNTPGGTTVFTVSNGTVADLNLGSYGHATAQGINNAGVILGNIDPQNGANAQGFFSDGTTLTLLTPDARAGGINDAGQIVGARFRADQTSSAFLFESGTYLDLGTLAGYTGSSATAINDNGQVVGVATGGPGTGTDTVSPFLFSDGAMHDLQSLLSNGSRWNLFNATGINNRGQIFGLGTFDGQMIPYLATPVPTTTAVPLPAAARPALATLAGLAACATVRHRRSTRAAAAHA